MKPVTALFILLTACSPRAEVSSHPWPHQLIQSLPGEHDGWRITEASGGGGEAGGAVDFKISLQGKTPSEAVGELKSLIHKTLREAGFKADGGGSATDGKNLTGFCISYHTDDSVGSVAVSFAPIDSSSMVVAAATAQQARPAHQ